MLSSAILGTMQHCSAIAGARSDFVNPHAGLHVDPLTARLTNGTRDALARKLISLDVDAASFEKVASLSLPLVAVGVAWMLVRSHRDRKQAPKASSAHSAHEVEG